MKSIRSRLPLFAAAGSLLLVILLQFGSSSSSSPLSLNRLESLTYDWRVRIAKKHVEPSSAFAGALIDNESIQSIADGSIGYIHGLYWPRYIYADLIDELQHRGVSTIGFDIIFSEERPDHGHYRLPSGEIMASDDIFGHGLRSAANVVIASEPQLIPPPVFATNAHSLGLIKVSHDPDGVLRRVKAFEDVRVWHPLITLASRQFGLNLNTAQVSSDEIVFKLREYDPFILELTQDGDFDPLDIVEELPEGISSSLAKPFEITRIWHLGLAMAAKHLDLDLQFSSIDKETGALVIDRPSSPPLRIPLDRDHNLLVNWELDVGDDILTLDNISTLLRNRRDRILGNAENNDFTEWRNRIALVGSVATGNDLTDLGPTPLSNSAYDLTTHWNVANSLITGRFVVQSSPMQQFWILVISGVISIGATLRLRVPWSTITIFILCGLYTWLAVWLYDAHRIWIPLIFPIIGGMLLTHVTAGLSRTIVDQREKRHIRRIFSQIVSPNIVDELLKEEELHLQGIRRKVTVLFADLRGFTAVTDTAHENASLFARSSEMNEQDRIRFLEGRTQEVLATVNLYLSQIAEEVKSHQGTLDKYIGDCVMAFWGAPTPTEDSAVRCVEAAIATQRRISALNTSRRKRNEEIKLENLARQKDGEIMLQLLPILEVGIGINTGDAIVGLMGSTHHIVNYTVFGREVNLASRLERLAGRGKIIVGESTLAELETANYSLASRCSDNPPVALKGIKNLVTTYEVKWND